MSLTEEARAPFSLVDEINQVNPHISKSAMVAHTGVVGHGSKGRKKRARFDGRGHLQT
jgi:hypothetical protein